MCLALDVVLKTIHKDKKELLRKTGTDSVVGLVKWLLKNGV
jgi:DNA-binding CsgD family transcriptional regulator